MYLRFFNEHFWNRLLIQDGLENFNGAIRSCCQIAVAPIASHYRSAFTTIILNNLITADSLNSNCEKDSATALLTDIHDDIMGLKKKSDQLIIPMNVYDDDDDDIIFEPESVDFGVDLIETEPMSSISYMSISSVCATVCQKILQKTKCPQCKTKMQAVGNVKETMKQNLECNENTSFVYPSDIFITNFKNYMDIC